MDLQSLGVAALGHQCHIARNIHLSGASVGATSADQRLACAGRTALIHNVSAEFVLEVAQRRHHRPRGKLPQSAQRTRFHPCGYLANGVQVLQLALSLGDAGQHLQHALPPHPAGDALAATLGGGEGEEEVGEFHYTGVLVHHDHPAGAHHRAEFF